MLPTCLKLQAPLPLCPLARSCRHTSPFVHLPEAAGIPPPLPTCLQLQAPLPLCPPHPLPLHCGTRTLHHSLPTRLFLSWTHFPPTHHVYLPGSVPRTAPQSYFPAFSLVRPLLHTAPPLHSTPTHHTTPLLHTTPHHTTTLSLHITCRNERLPSYSVALASRSLTSSWRGLIRYSFPLNSDDPLSLSPPPLSSSHPDVHSLLPMCTHCSHCLLTALLEGLLPLTASGRLLATLLLPRIWTLFPIRSASC